jgi:hypothetical protein
MLNDAIQSRLSVEQIEAFYHDQFVDDQLRDFTELVPSVPEGRRVVDIGGGCGFFAAGLKAQKGWQTRVVDSDLISISICERNGIEAVFGDASAPKFVGDEDVVCFNLIVHHLIGTTEAATRNLQKKALTAWCGHARAVFVNEYIYQSFVGHVSGWLIYQITSSRILSWIGARLASVVPSLKANTFGIGVRFRSHEEWLRLFAEAGYKISGVRIGAPEHISPPLRSLFIRRIRRDSFLLIPTETAA